MGLKSYKLYNNIFEGKKVLVTGDTGFKGSWLSLWLTELGAEVYGYALPPQNKNDNFVMLNLENKITHENGDIRDYDNFLRYVKEINPDIAFHLAAQALVLESYANPKGTFETNLMGTVHFFEAVRNCKSIKAAINVTSDKCYQNNEQLWPYKESDSMGGNDPYSASKGASEIITNSYLQSFFMSDKNSTIASVRAGNVVGGGDWAKDRIIPDFFRALINDETLNIRNPKAIRPWQHVLEPLSGYLLLCSLLYKDGNTYSGGWNFGPLPEYTYNVEDVIKGIIKTIHNGSYKSADNNQASNEAKILRLDISKATQKLNWFPTLSFKETIEFTVKGYMDEINGKNLYRSRLEQIKEFIDLSIERNGYL